MHSNSLNSLPYQNLPMIKQIMVQQVSEHGWKRLSSSGLKSRRQIKTIPNQTSGGSTSSTHIKGTRKRPNTNARKQLVSSNMHSSSPFTICGSLLQLKKIAPHWYTALHPINTNNSTLKQSKRPLVLEEILILMLALLVVWSAPASVLKTSCIRTYFRNILTTTIMLNLRQAKEERDQTG
jgi:hypothetical protein